MQNNLTSIPYHVIESLSSNINHDSDIFATLESSGCGCFLDPLHCLLCLVNSRSVGRVGLRAAGRRLIHNNLVSIEHENKYHKHTVHRVFVQVVVSMKALKICPFIPNQATRSSISFQQEPMVEPKFAFYANKTWPNEKYQQPFKSEDNCPCMHLSVYTSGRNWRNVW